MNEQERSAAQLAVRAFAPFLPPALQAALAVFEKTLDVRPSAIIADRLTEMHETWRAELRRPIEADYHPQFLDAQSLTQLLILVIEATVRDRLSEKRRMYGRLLARADTPEWGDKVGRVEEALAALIQISEGDLRVLKPIMSHVKATLKRGVIHEPEYLEAAAVSVRALQEQLPDLSDMGVKTYTTRLERLGLLLPKAGNTADGYVPTHLLEELITLVRDEGTS